MTKICKTCGETKPHDDFHRHRHTADGHTADCKVCACARARKWNADNAERARQASSEYYYANREAAAETNRRWRERNPDKVAEGKRRAKRKLKAERPLEYAIRHRFEIRGLPTTRAALDYGMTLVQDPCSYCGGPAGHLDHIVPTASGGSNEWDNLTASCSPCNTRKKRAPLLLALLSMNGDGR